jgi:hypothetical protein
MKTDEYGNKRWFNEDGELHRDNDLPAIEQQANGDKHWYANGQLHRDNDLPAREYANGDKFWYVNGKSHRNNDLPAIITANRNKHWYVNNMRHRLGGLPAIKQSNGSRYWYIYNKEYAYSQICNYYKILKNFSRYCLRKIRMRKLRRLRWIHGELLCMPAKGSYLGGQDYYQMVNYFMSM